MNYYEELGLDPAASPEQIRKAYKDLARLLHPDHQDEAVRGLAGCQMKRLNEVVAVLTDPGRRRRYDEELAAGVRTMQLVPVPRAQVAPLRWRASTAWMAAAALGLAALAWLWRGNPSPPATAAVREAPPAPVAAAARRSMPRRQRPADPEPRRVERRRAPPSARVSAPPPDGAAPPAIPMPDLPAAVSLPAIAPPALPEPAVPFAGTWFFAQARPRGVGLYAPEYIEAAIEERAGIVRGHYRARYLVPDRTFSPEIAFEFEGRGASPSAELAWQGQAGARGELRLRLTSQNTLELSWWTTEFGPSPALASGTAVLVRRR